MVKEGCGGCNLTTVETPAKTLQKHFLIRPAARLLVPCLALLLAFPALTLAQAAVSAISSAAIAPPPSNGGIFPLDELRRGMRATAWTVFTGSKPEPMEVEILGILRGARGPGHDMILAQLHGAKPEYTGVVAGMSGSPVYIGNRLLGALSYRIGQFSKDPIAGITPIAQMLEVRDLPILDADTRSSANASASLLNSASGSEVRLDNGMNLRAMETPLLMSGFHPEAIRLWQQKMAGTSLETVAAGGMSSSSATGTTAEASAKALTTVLPGSAVSAQLVRGDLEVAATCTVTYIDPKQLLACGHPILQAGTVSVPMTTTEVLATLASPMNAFKIVSTGETIGAFTEDRDAAIRGVFAAKARMIPMHLAVHTPTDTRKLNVDVLDLPSLTPQAVMVVVYESLLQSNESTFETSYHLTGSIDLESAPATKLNLWVSSGSGSTTPMEAALSVAESFVRLYSNQTRRGMVRGVNLQIEAIPHRVQVELAAARLVNGNIVHAGDTVVVEATIQPWQQAARNVRIPITLPTRLNAGNLRLLVSDAGTLDRAMNQPRNSNRSADLNSVQAQMGRQHPADRIYVSLLVPETQAGVDGQTLSSLPLSMANILEPLRNALEVNLNGESAIAAADAPAEGVLNGFQILNLRIEAGGGLN